MIHLPNRQIVPVGILVAPKGTAHFYHHIRLLGIAFGSCHVALAPLDEPKQDLWFLVSDETTDLQTFDEYGLQFDLEENFLDDESNGFQVEASCTFLRPCKDCFWFWRGAPST